MKCLKCEHNLIVNNKIFCHYLGHNFEIGYPENDKIVSFEYGIKRTFDISSQCPMIQHCLNCTFRCEDDGRSVCVVQDALNNYDLIDNVYKTGTRCNYCKTPEQLINLLENQSDIINELKTLHGSNSELFRSTSQLDRIRRFETVARLDILDHLIKFIEDPEFRNYIKNLRRNDCNEQTNPK